MIDDVSESPEVGVSDSRVIPTCACGEHLIEGTCPACAGPDDFVLPSQALASLPGLTLAGVFPGLPPVKHWEPAIGLIPSPSAHAAVTPRTRCDECLETGTLCAKHLVMRNTRRAKGYGT